jgi:hypothetical protein
VFAFSKPHRILKDMAPVPSSSTPGRTT